MIFFFNGDLFINAFRNPRCVVARIGLRPALFPGDTELTFGPRLFPFPCTRPPKFLKCNDLPYRVLAPPHRFYYQLGNAFSCFRNRRHLAGKNKTPANISATDQNDMYESECRAATSALISLTHFPRSR